VNDTLFIIFEEEDESAPMYQIINECYNLKVEYWQILPQEPQAAELNVS
jgi:hypothetical protein